MKSLTIHNIEEPLLSLLREKARESKTSINQFVKNVLERSLGFKKSEQPPHISEFSDLCGVWSKQEQTAFDAIVSDLEKVDKEDWK